MHKKLIRIAGLIGFLVVMLSPSQLQAQAHTPEVWTFNPVMEQALSDSGLVNKEMRIYQYGVPPGRVDTMAHRHPGELFVYVQEGAIEYRMGDHPPVLFEAGSVLYEPPYSLHTLFRNPSDEQQAKLLLIYVATRGKPLTIREH